MKRLVDRFGEEAASCQTLDQLHTLLSGVCVALDFQYYALLHHISLSSARSGHIRLDNYPLGWAEELINGGLAIDDPVHRASRRVNTGFAWGELARIIHLEPQHKAILSRSRDFGIGDGFTIPANVPGEPSGSCSFAVRAGMDLPERRLRCAELVGAHAFRAARRLLGLPVCRRRPHLSRRESQCLRLVVLGKTDWEIGTILGISTETARQYVKRARAAYDVVTRTQLAVLALRDEWVDFEGAGLWSGP
jgi:LuxR family quorum-sensing system transcriptional regulator CciR